MLSWWDSIEKVSKFYTYMQISIAVFGFFTASATYFSIKAANRISEIQSEKESETHKRLEATEAANKALEKQVKDATDKIKSNLRPTIRVDVSSSDKIEYLPKSGVISYVKIDNSANKVIIKPKSKKQTVWGLPFVELTGQGETITLELSGNDWIRKQ